MKKKMHMSRSVDAGDGKVQASSHRINSARNDVIGLFIKNDIPRIIAELKDIDQTKAKKEKNMPIFSDIGDFMNGVHEDLKLMYPSVADRPETAIRLFSMQVRSTETSAT